MTHFRGLKGTKTTDTRKMIVKEKFKVMINKSQLLIIKTSHQALLRIKTLNISSKAK